MRRDTRVRLCPVSGLRWAAMQAKFNANENLQKTLIDTGNKPIRYIDASPTWGYNDGNGQNLVGLYLERLRDHYRGYHAMRSAAGAGASTSAAPQ